MIAKPELQSSHDLQKQGHEVETESIEKRGVGSIAATEPIYLF